MEELVAKADIRVAAEVMKRKEAQDAADRAAETKAPIIEEEEVPDAA
jgi:hypothetical protein